MLNLDLLLPKLKESINTLETAICTAKERLKTNSNFKQHHSDRVDSYFSIVNKQRELVKELETSLLTITNPSNEEILERSRVINLINALSTMIKDDARDLLDAILTSSNTNKPPLE